MITIDPIDYKKALALEIRNSLREMVNVASRHATPSNYSEKQLERLHKLIDSIHDDQLIKAVS